MSSKGFYLGTPDGRFQLRLRGVLQADGRSYLADESRALTDQFLVRRARIYFEGNVGEAIDFRVLPEFGQGNFQLLDVWVNLKVTEWAQLRVGKVKSPFGLERLQAEQNLVFAERGLTSNLAPDRDVGADVHGVVASTVEYDFGVFDGVPDGASVDGDLSGFKDVDGRVFVLPFKRTSLSALHQIGVGIAGSWGRQTGTATSTNLPVYRSAGQQTIFAFISDPKTGVAVASGERWRVSPQAYAYLGSFGLQAEYVRAVERVQRGAYHDTLGQQAWQAQLSWAVTGETESYEGIDPSAPFSLSQRTFGAIEVAARVGQLLLDSGAFAHLADPNLSVRKATEVGGAVSWYLSRNARFGASFSRTGFEGGRTGGDRAPEYALIARAQVAF
ncbi:MAG: porin [Myxococcaceae bacterium]